MNRRIFLLSIIIIIFLLVCFMIYFSHSDETQFSLPVVADSRNEVTLPILMYHGITDLASEVGEYTIHKDTFENDLKWLGENGYTTISLRQLIDYVEKGTRLPSKPILITFDDGHASDYVFAFPLLQKYHMKGVFSVIGSSVDTSSGDLYRQLDSSSVTWGEVALMASSGSAEIGSHTFDLHSVSGGRKGADKKQDESQEKYEEILLEDLMKNNEKILKATGAAPLLFAWPYGAYPRDGSADKILKEAGYKVSVTSYQTMNTIRQGEPNSLFGLKRFLRTPDFDMNRIIWYN